MGLPNVGAAAKAMKRKLNWRYMPSTSAMNTQPFTIPMGWGNGRATGMIRHISAVTFAVRDMARSVEFYTNLGFELLHGGDAPEFSSIACGRNPTGCTA